jgi:NTE family protein
VEYRSELQEVYEDGRAVADYDVSRLYGRLDAGLQLRQYAELRAGPFWGTGRAEVNTGAADLPETEDDLSGVHASLVVDRQDRSAFPQQGYYLDLEGQTVTTDLGGDVDFDKVQMALRGQQSFGDHTLMAGVQAGSSLGSELPVYAQFTLGGPFGFSGLAQNQFRGTYQGILTLSYRYRLVELPRQIGRGIYALVRGDVGNVWMDDVDLGDLRQGALVGLGADTALGPLFFGYGRSDEGFDRFYLTLGTLF